MKAHLSGRPFPSFLVELQNKFREAKEEHTARCYKKAAELLLKDDLSRPKRKQLKAKHRKALERLRDGKIERRQVPREEHGPDMRLPLRVKLQEARCCVEKEHGVPDAIRVHDYVIIELETEVAVTNSNELDQYLRDREFIESVVKSCVENFWFDNKGLQDLGAELGVESEEGAETARAWTPFEKFLLRLDRDEFLKTLLGRMPKPIAEAVTRLGLRPVEFCKDDLPILSADASMVYEILLAHPAHRGLTGPVILDVLAKRGRYIDSSTLTTRIIRELKPYGIENLPRIGYRIPASSRSEK